MDKLKIIKNLEVLLLILINKWHLSYSWTLNLSFFLREYLKVIAKEEWIWTSRPRFMQLADKQPLRGTLRSAIDMLEKLATQSKEWRGEIKLLSPDIEQVILNFNTSITWIPKWKWKAKSKKQQS